MDNEPERIDILKKTLLTMPEHSFFSLARTYLGSLRTPFHKPAIADGLCSFLLRPQTRNAVLERITRKDAEFLTAVAVLAGPEPSALHSLFEEEKPFFEIQRHIANLVERLLLLQTETSAGSRLILNPILEPELRASALDSDILIPSAPAELGDGPDVWLTENLAASFLCFLENRGEVFRNDGTVRKHAEKELRETFPRLFADSDPLARKSGEPRLRLLLESLRGAGLLMARGGKLCTDPDGIRAFAEGGREAGRFVLWGGSLSGVSDLRQRGPLMRRFLEYLLPDRGYEPAALARCGRLAAIKASLPPEMGSALHELAQALNLLVPAGDGRFALNPHMFHAEKRKEPGGRWGTLLPNFELAVREETPFELLRRIAAFAEIRRFDTVSVYTITKESVFRGLRGGLDLSRILATLYDMTGAEPSQNVGYNLSTWAGEYETLRLYEGTVLLVDEKRRYIVEHSAAMNAHIRAVLAPGIYLLDSAEREAWSRALRDLGFDPLPGTRLAGSLQPHAKKDTARGAAADPPVRRPPVSARAPEELLPRFTPSDPLKFSDAGAAKKGLLEALEKLQLPGDRKSELEGKIRSGIILFAEQLFYAPGGKEKTEARGIDFAGKVRLIEQAIASGEEYLEAVERLANGDPLRRVLRPLGIERSGTELWVVGTNVPGNDKVRIRIGKLSLVRKIKGSDYVEVE